MFKIIVISIFAQHHNFFLLSVFLFFFYPSNKFTSVGLTDTCRLPVSPAHSF